MSWREDYADLIEEAGEVGFALATYLVQMQDTCITLKTSHAYTQRHSGAHIRNPLEGKDLNVVDMEFPADKIDEGDLDKICWALRRLHEIGLEAEQREEGGKDGVPAT